MAVKLLIFSDPHLVGQQSDARFAACLSQALERHGDAAHILVAGDLCEEPGAYPLLAEHLVATGLPVTCLMGNVDDRAAFAAAMPGVTPGFQQATLSFGRHLVITLDTLDEDPSAAPSGVLCDARLSDLEARLKAAEGQIITLVMHHPPAPFGMPFVDPIGLRTGSEVLRLLERWATMTVFVPAGGGVGTRLRRNSGRSARPSRSDRRPMSRISVCARPNAKSA